MFFRHVLTTSSEAISNLFVSYQQIAAKLNPLPLKLPSWLAQSEKWFPKGSKRHHRNSPKCYQNISIYFLFNLREACPYIAFSLSPKQSRSSPGSELFLQPGETIQHHNRKVDKERVTTQGSGVHLFCKSNKPHCALTHFGPIPSQFPVPVQLQCSAKEQWWT